jgi:hypothetical protein
MPLLPKGQILSIHMYHTSSTTFMATIFAFFLFFFFLLWILGRAKTTGRKPTLPPEASGAWPYMARDRTEVLAGAMSLQMTRKKIKNIFY